MIILNINQSSKPALLRSFLDLDKKFNLQHT